MPSRNRAVKNFKISRWTGSLTGAVLVLLILYPRDIQAQDKDWEKEGGIPNADIEIVKDRKITLPPAERNFEKIPPRPVDPVKQEITYDYKNLKFSTADYSPLIRPLKLKQEEISKIYGNYVSGGAGNYASPYLEAYFNSKRDKNQFYGAHFYHHSFGTGPVDGKNSASGSSEISVFGKSIQNAVTTSGNLNYENQSTYFYGYVPGTEPARDNFHQTYSIISAQGALENSKPSDLNFKTQIAYSYLEDHFKTSEGEFGLTGMGSYNLKEKMKLLLNVDYYMINRKDSMISHKARNLFKVRPAYVFSPIEKLWFTAGLNIAAEDDNGSKLHVFPNLHADYAMSETVTAYAGLTGDVDKVDLHTLSRENIWVGSDLTMRHTIRTAEILGGLKGKFSGKFAFGTGFSFATLNNLYNFRNMALDRSRFEVIYGNTTRTNIFGEIGFSQGEKMKVDLRGDFYGYTTDVLHKPKYRLALNSSYNVFDKLWLTIDFIGQGGMKTFDFEKNARVSIPGALDLNAKVDYFFSRRVSAFVKFNNLLSNNYQLYLHYPVRGFQVMGGVSCSF
jgi:hypothetical protein